MKKKLLTLVLTFVLVIMPNINVKAENIDVDKDSINTKEMLEQSEYKEGELIVIFKDEMSNKSIKKVINNEDASVKEIIEITDDNKASLVQISDEDDMESAIEKFKDNSKVEYVQPNYKYGFFEDEEDLYKDPRNQYHFTNIKAKEAWALIESNTYSATKVAVIDTGVDVYHEDLQVNLVDTTNYYAALGGKLIARDYDAGDHGTHVTGIIGATYNNGIGVAGVAAGNSNDLVRVMVVGSSPDGEGLYTADIIESINYAKESGAKVINMSFGGEGRDRAMEAAVKDAYDAGIVLVAASGNDETNVYSSPADFKEVISVNASNRYDKPTYWSDYGTYKDITAPGNNIISTVPGDDYMAASGTSMASPVVAAVAALVLDANPSLTPAQVYNILCASTGYNGFDQYLAYGIVDAKAAVEAAYAASDSVSVTDLSIKETEAEVYVNDNISLETLVKPAASLKSVTWSSSDDTVATVDSVTGRVTGVNEGVAVITASVDGFSVTCEVTVKSAVAQTGISIVNKEEFENIAIGYESSLDARIMPEDATNQEIYYKSSNRNVVDVDEMGYVTAVGEGTATLTVKTYDGAYSDTVTVNVHNDARSVIMTAKPDRGVLLVEDEFTYQAEARDINNHDVTEYHPIIWSSTNIDVATVDKTTGKVTAVGEGTTYIVATASKTNRDYAINKSYRLIVGKRSYSQTEYGLTVKTKNYNTINLSWKRLPITCTYEVYRATAINGDYQLVKDGLTSINYTDTNLKFNTRYYYMVKAKFHDGTMLGNSYKRTTITVLTKPTLSITSPKSKQLKLSWTKVDGATGYSIYRATSLKGKYTQIKKTTGLTYTNKKLTSGKKYYYKVIAYRGTVFSPYYSNTAYKVVK